MRIRLSAVTIAYEVQGLVHEGELEDRSIINKVHQLHLERSLHPGVPLYCTLPSWKTSDYYNLRTKCLPSLISPFEITEPTKNLFKAFDFKTLWSPSFGMPIEFHSLRITNFPNRPPLRFSSLINSCSVSLHQFPSNGPLTSTVVQPSRLWLFSRSLGTLVILIWNIAHASWCWK